MLRMITNRSPSTKLKPLPRAAQTNRSPSPAPRKQTGAPPPRRYAASPSPYGGE